MKKNSKSALMLMELIIAILFFSVSSAICVQLFVSSHIKSQNSADLSIATNQAQTVAEMFIALDGDIQALAKEVYAKKSYDNTYVCYYNQQGEFDSKDFSYYELRFSPKIIQGINSLDIYTYKKDFADQPPIYSLQISCYTQQTQQKVVADKWTIKNKQTQGL